jgi:hypothetical protein
VADGRPKVIGVELGVATAFALLGAALTAQRPIDATEIGGIVIAWPTYAPTMFVLGRSRFDADSLD